MFKILLSTMTSTHQRRGRAALVCLLSTLSFTMASCAQSERVTTSSAGLSQGSEKNTHIPARPTGPRPTSGLLFVPGDRIVWLGDSITAAHTYGR